MTFEQHQYGPERESWESGFIRSKLSDGVTRYVAAGASVSAPSENLGFYFSGVRGEDWGPITENDYSADTISDKLISVDMSTMRKEVWSNDSLPDDVPGRVNGELVWLPVSDSGVLVAIGGVINAEDTFQKALNDSQVKESVSYSKRNFDLLSLSKPYRNQRARVSWKVFRSTISRRVIGKI